MIHKILRYVPENILMVKLRIALGNFYFRLPICECMCVCVCVSFIEIVNILCNLRIMCKLTKRQYKWNPWRKLGVGSLEVRVTCSPSRDFLFIVCYNSNAILLVILFFFCYSPQTRDEPTTL